MSDEQKARIRAIAEEAIARDQNPNEEKELGEWIDWLESAGSDARVAVDEDPDCEDPTTVPFVRETLIKIIAVAAACVATIDGSGK